MIQAFPGCCGIDVSHSVNYEDPERWLKEDIQSAKESGLHCVLYSTVADQKEVIAALKKLKFTPIFKSRRNDNHGGRGLITLWAKRI